MGKVEIKGYDCPLNPSDSQSPHDLPLTPRVVPLAQLARGQTATVDGPDATGIVSSGDAAYLRAMGLRPNARIRVCRLGQPCIVEVMTGDADCGQSECGCRIGLSKELAQHLMVRV
jgi:Fe2+ transport system protein FeoA